MTKRNKYPEVNVSEQITHIDIGAGVEQFTKNEWETTQVSHSPIQVRMLKRLAKHGMKGIPVASSPEAVPGPYNSNLRPGGIVLKH